MPPPPVAVPVPAPVPPGAWPPPKPPRAPPPPGPPIPPATVGPALGMEPVCGVAAVSTAYAAGPASATISPAPASTAAVRRGSTRTSSSPIETGSPAASTTGASHGRKSALRSSSTYDQAAVTASVIARTSAPSRRRRSAVAPMPTTAPIAGRCSRAPAPGSSCSASRRCRARPGDTPEGVPARRHAGGRPRPGRTARRLAGPRGQQRGGHRQFSVPWSRRPPSGPTLAGPCAPLSPTCECLGRFPFPLF